MFIIRWIFSRQVRLAMAMRRHVEKILAAQSDLLTPQAIAAVREATGSLSTAVRQGADKAKLAAEMENLEQAANKWLKPYPHAAWRENVEVFLVAIAVAMGIRTFFLQPFKIPTGSMQPTLYGITPQLFSGNEPDLKIPDRLTRFLAFWFSGEHFFHVVAPEDGVLEYVKPPEFMGIRLGLFNIKQDYRFNGRWYSVWFPAENLFERAGYRVDPESHEVRRVDLVRREIESRQPTFRRGDDIIRLKVLAGDHLFVNRLVYNFRHPERGDIIVFSTKGFDPEFPLRFNQKPVPANQYYIKRLVALGGEKVKIGEDQHLIIDGQRLDSATPHFENLYQFRPDAGDDEYFGHEPRGIFAGPQTEYLVRPDHYMVMGDNTRNSLDSRYLADFPREEVIGKSSFVYWPISSRFGWGYR